MTRESTTRPAVFVPALRPSSASSSQRREIPDSPVTPTATEHPAGHLSLEVLGQLTAELKRDDQFLLAQNLLQESSIDSLLINQKKKLLDKPIFNHEVNMQGITITDQSQSGSCWLSSTLSMLSVSASKIYNLHDFQLSHAYLVAYSHISKANAFLELVLDYANKPIESRTMQIIFRAAQVQDGGNFDEAIELLSEFGIVPHTVFAETWNSLNTADMNSLLNSKLRDYALELRKAYNAAGGAAHHDEAVEEAAKLKKNMLKSVVRVVLTVMGDLPDPRKEFTWEFRDRANKFQAPVKCTPLEFFNKIASPSPGTTPHDFRDSIVLTHDPRKEYGTIYTRALGGIVVGARRQPQYFNVESSVFQQVVIQQLQSDVPVWCALDIAKAKSSSRGYLDQNLYNYSLSFGLTLKMSKAQRIQTADSAPNHAMVFVGVHTDERGTPVRYKLLNSWGPSSGINGYAVMSPDFFENFVYQIAAPPAVFNQNLLQRYHGAKTVVMDAWDPMSC